MSDPLSLYANEDDDIENYLPDPSESQNEGGQHDDVEHKESLSENEETAQQKQVSKTIVISRYCIGWFHTQSGEERITFMLSHGVIIYFLFSYFLIIDANRSAHVRLVGRSCQ